MIRDVFNHWANNIDWNGQYAVIGCKLQLLQVLTVNIYLASFIAVVTGA